MEKPSRLDRFHDSFLARKWVKYLLLPGIEAAPTAVAALWVGLGHTTFEGYNAAWLIFGASLLGGALAASRTAFLEAANEKIADLVAKQKQLLRLVGHVRVIVTAKSRRFFEALRDLPNPVDPGRAFLTITQPEEQIKEIVRNTHEYFYYSPDTESNETIAVQLMRWNDAARHLEFVQMFPHTERPRTAPSEFGDMSTISGRAFHTRSMVISENVAADSRYKKLSDSPEGSMFSYPIWDDFELKVAFVVNVVSSKIQRFREEDREALDIPMRVFGERLLLESKLAGLKARVQHTEDSHG